MDAHLFVDVNCPRNCRRSRARHSNRNRSRPSVRKNGRSLEPLQLQIPRISLRSRYGLHGVFWCSIFREPAGCCRLSAYPDLDWFLAHLSRGALFVRCCVRCNPWNSFCRSCSAPFISLAVSSASRISGTKKSAATRRNVTADSEMLLPLGVPQLLIVEHRLRCRFPYFDLRAHFLDGCTK